MKTDSGLAAFIASPARKLRQEAFICGCGHSGTTILANILAAHPEVFVPLNETNVFRKKPWAARVELAMLRLNAKRAAKPVLLEKTPKHIRRLDLLFRLSPHARLIVPVRDGRDVAASIAKRNGGDLDKGIDRWIADNTIVSAIRNQPNVFCYRYEDFIENPQFMLKKICGFLEIDWRESLFDYHKQSRNWFNQKAVKAAAAEEHEAYRNWQVNQPIFDGRNKWRQTYFEADMSRLYEGEGGDLMRAWNYI